MADDSNTTAEAENAGLDFANGLTVAERKGMAYNALNKVYGPAIANDPAQAAAAANASVDQAIAPLKVQEAQRVNAAGNALVGDYGAEAGDPSQYGAAVGAADAQDQAARMAAFRGIQVLKQTPPRADGSLDPTMVQKVLGDNTGLMKAHPDQINALMQTLTAPGGAQHLDPMAQALIGPTKIVGSPTIAKDANGNSVMVNRDQYGNEIPTPLAPGLTPVQQQRADQGQQNADTHQFVAATGRMNAGTSAYRANTTANNSQYGNPGGTAPLPGDNRPSADRGGGNALPAPSTDLIHAGNPPGTTTTPAAPPLQGRPLATRTAAATQLMANTVNLQNANRVADSMVTQITPYTTGAGSLMKDIPGSVATDLKHNAETLQAQAAQAVLSGMKNAQGNTGIGRVLQAEYKNFTAMYGNLSQDQSTRQYAFHLQLLRQSLNNMLNIQNSGFKTQWGTDPATALGQTPQTAAPTAPTGWKVLH